MKNNFKLNAKLYFKYGAMGSGKSLELIRVAYNYIERDLNVLLLTSSLDDRFNENLKKKIDCVLIDESQFLKKNYIVEQLTEIVDKYKIPVMCYGLRSDYKLNAFEGSLYLMYLLMKFKKLSVKNIKKWK